MDLNSTISVTLTLAPNTSSRNPSVGVAQIEGFCIRMFCKRVEQDRGIEELKKYILNISVTIKTNGLTRHLTKALD
jgi:hypothetical protein